MTDKTTIMRGFNNHFFEFLDDILRIYPENHEMKEARTTFEIIKKANPTAILKAWQTFVYEKYKDVIVQGNMDFFFEKDYSDDLAHMANAAEIMKTIDIIRGPIQQMTAENKAIVSRYVENLCKLSQMYTKIAGR